MRSSLDDVAVFVEVADAGSFARAAERLGLTRSAVGKAVARLEGRLDVRLFHRTTRSLSLSEEGHVYHERCLRALDEIRVGEALLDSGRREVSGRLKISMPVLFGRYCVQPILLELACQQPKLELDLRFSDTIVDIISEGFDLAIRNGAPGVGSGLLTRRITTQTKVLCAAPTYLATHGLPTAPSDLADHEALVYWRGGHPFPWALRDGDRIVEPALRWRLQFDSQEAIVDAAVLGLGVAWVPNWLVHVHIAAGRLVTLLDRFPSLPLETYAVWPSTNYMPMRLRATVDALAIELPKRVMAASSGNQ